MSKPCCYRFRAKLDHYLYVTLTLDFRPITAYIVREGETS